MVFNPQVVGRGRGCLGTGELPEFLDLDRRGGHSGLVQEILSHSTVSTPRLPPGKEGAGYEDRYYHKQDGFFSKIHLDDILNQIWPTEL